MDVGGFFCLVESSGAVVMFCPVAAGQTCVGNCRAGIRGVDKLAIACVNTNMSYSGPAGIGEEYDITGFQVAFADKCSLCIQCLGSSIRRIAKGLQYVVHKTGTVKSGRRGSAIYIRRSEILRCLVNNLLSGNRAFVSPGITITAVCLIRIPGIAVVVAAVTA